MKKTLLVVTLLLVVVGMLILSPVALGQRTYPLENCLAGAFSTEEDFMMTRGEPYDGNPYISDGDLLSPSGQLCARNADLLVNFNPAGVAPADLGLDAVDILAFKDRLVAFSTSLDDPFGKFSAGDLLFTDGGVIPNSALVARFGIKHDIGLDAVQLIGAPENIRGFVNRVREADPQGWDQGLLNQLLETFKVDIWFSIEGTHFAENPILDGDLLSAQGHVVAPNSALLPPDVPAGLPVRGVDFGLDAVSASRLPDGQPLVLFSTEILYRGERAFTDGDVLRIGDGVMALNEDLIAAWHPRADFLGLDALWLLTEPPPLEDPFITHLCGEHSAGDFDGGLVGIGGGGTGLHSENPDATWPDGRPRQPCGRFVPVDGFMPDSGVTRFRVAYRPDGAAYLGTDTHEGIRTAWRIYQRAPFWPFPCTLSGNLSTDANGWMDANTYMGYKDGTLTGGCPNNGLQLAVWNTDNMVGFEPGPADENGHYVLWLEYDDGTTIAREPVEHHVQLDNVLPVINDFQVTLQDGSTPVDACGEAPNGEHIFKVYADFADDYYWGYLLRVRGGAPPDGETYGWHNYYDGTAAVVNTDRTGTKPDATTVLLRSIDMEDLEESFTDCCYVLDLWVRDGAIRHSFNKRVATEDTGSSAYWTNEFLTFAAAP